MTILIKEQRRPAFIDFVSYMSQSRDIEIPDPGDELFQNEYRHLVQAIDSLTIFNGVSIYVAAHFDTYKAAILTQRYLLNYYRRHKSQRITTTLKQDDDRYILYIGVVK